MATDYSELANWTLEVIRADQGNPAEQHAHTYSILEQDPGDETSLLHKASGLHEDLKAAHQSYIDLSNGERQSAVADLQIAAGKLFGVLPVRAYASFGYTFRPEVGLSGMRQHDADTTTIDHKDPAKFYPEAVHRIIEPAKVGRIDGMTYAEVVNADSFADTMLGQRLGEARRLMSHTKIEFVQIRIALLEAGFSGFKAWMNMQEYIKSHGDEATLPPATDALK